MGDFPIQAAFRIQKMSLEIDASNVIVDHLSSVPGVSRIAVFKYEHCFDCCEKYSLF